MKRVATWDLSDSEPDEDSRDPDPVTAVRVSNLWSFPMCLVTESAATPSATLVESEEVDSAFPPAPGMSTASISIRSPKGAVQTQINFPKKDMTGYEIRRSTVNMVENSGQRQLLITDMLPITPTKAPREKREPKSAPPRAKKALVTPPAPPPGTWRDRLCGSLDTLVDELELMVSRWGQGGLLSDVPAPETHPSWARGLRMLLEDQDQGSFFSALVSKCKCSLTSIFWWFGQPRDKLQLVILNDAPWTPQTEKLVMRQCYTLKKMTAPLTFPSRTKFFEDTGIVMTSVTVPHEGPKYEQRWAKFWKSFGIVLETVLPESRLVFFGKSGLKRENVFYLPSLSPITVHTLNHIPFSWS
uniref:ORF48 n=1 Tax=Latid herpesvirus 1 TaxID=3096545 RepID=A0AB33V9A1_9VIRU